MIQSDLGTNRGVIYIAQCCRLGWKDTKIENDFMGMADLFVVVVVSS